MIYMPAMDIDSTFMIPEIPFIFLYLRGIICDLFIFLITTNFFLMMFSHFLFKKNIMSERFDLKQLHTIEKDCYKPTKFTGI